jgi:sec-independent protein translocase protein TatB
MGFEMIFIFLLALILFGPKRLPGMAREIGKFVAEFKRASNDFKYQLQSEIEKAGTDPTPPPQSGAQPAVTGAQQTSTFTQTLLPPAVTSAVSETEGAHERLMKTARMAFDAQNFTLRPPEPPPVAASPEPDQPSAPPPELSNQPASQPTAFAPSQDSFPVEAETDHAAPDSATANSNSAPQRS